MITTSPPWRPHIGDRVSIKGTCLSGTVQRINGHGADRRYIISGAPDSRTVYWLEELEPVK